MQFNQHLPRRSTFGAGFIVVKEVCVIVEKVCVVDEEVCVLVNVTSVVDCSSSITVLEVVRKKAVT